MHVNEVWCRPCPTNLHSPTQHTHTHNNTHTTHTHTTQQHTHHTHTHQHTHINTHTPTHTHTPTPTHTPKGGAPKGGGPKMSLFFPSSSPIFVLFLSLWGSSRGILVVFEAPGPSNVHVWALGLSCETPAVRWRAVRWRAVRRKGGPAGGRSRGRVVRTTQTTPPHTNWIFTRKSGPHTHTHTHQHSNTPNTHTNTHTHKPTHTHQHSNTHTHTPTTHNNQATTKPTKGGPKSVF